MCKYTSELRIRKSQENASPEHRQWNQAPHHIPWASCGASLSSVGCISAEIFTAPQSPECNWKSSLKSKTFLWGKVCGPVPSGHTLPCTYPMLHWIQHIACCGQSVHPAVRRSGALLAICFAFFPPGTQNDDTKIRNCDPQIGKRLVLNTNHSKYVLSERGSNFTSLSFGCGCCTHCQNFTCFLKVSCWRRQPKCTKIWWPCGMNLNHSYTKLCRGTAQKKTPPVTYKQSQNTPLP